MVHVVSVNYSLKICNFSCRSPFDPLVHDNVVENEIENSVAEDADCKREQIWIEDYNCRIIKKSDAGQTKD
jgi:hypothetical protein